MSAVLAGLLVFVGCGSNVVFLEYLIKEVPSSGNIITFGHFLFIAVHGFIFTTKFGTVKPKISLAVYFKMVALFFVVQVTNNYAFTYDVPMTLHMIFRSGSLMANLVLGRIITKKEYTARKYLSVVLITLGIILATIASANSIEETNSNKIVIEGEEPEVLQLSIGIALLLFALFMSAYMGIYQEQVYAKHGKHPSEALFYNHALPLPGFIFLSKDIYNQAILINQSAPVALPFLSFGIPGLWLHLAGNIFTQYVCIRSVFVLTTECPSLIVTLVVTLRKFASLVFSIWYFGNEFTSIHWVATALVFGGTLLFMDVFTSVYRYLVPEKKKVE